MCFSKTPTYTAPPVAQPGQAVTPPAQAARQPVQSAGPATDNTSSPDVAAGRKKAKDGAGTLLTGPSGIENAQLNLGRSSLLGG